MRNKLEMEIAIVILIKTKFGRNPLVTRSRGKVSGQTNLVNSGNGRTESFCGHSDHCAVLYIVNNNTTKSSFLFTLM